LGGAILKQGKYTEAEQLLMATIQLCKEVLGIHSNIMDELLGNQVNLLIDKGENQPALEWSIYRAERADTIFGEDHLVAMNVRRKLQAV
jgi:hypothetical protein